MLTSDPKRIQEIPLPTFVAEPPLNTFVANVISYLVTLIRILQNLYFIYPN